MEEETTNEMEVAAQAHEEAQALKEEGGCKIILIFTQVAEYNRLAPVEITKEKIVFKYRTAGKIETITLTTLP